LQSLLTEKQEPLSIWTLICLLLLVKDLLSGSRLKLQFFLPQAVQSRVACLDKLLLISSESLT